MIDLSYVRGRAQDYAAKAEAATDPFLKHYFTMAAAYWQTAADEIAEDREAWKRKQLTPQITTR